MKHTFLFLTALAGITLSQCEINSASSTNNIPQTDTSKSLQPQPTSATPPAPTKLHQINENLVSLVDYLTSLQTSLNLPTQAPEHFDSKNFKIHPSQITPQTKGIFDFINSLKKLTASTTQFGNVLRKSPTLTDVDQNGLNDYGNSLDKFSASGNQFENVLAKMPKAFESVASPGSQMQLDNSSNGEPAIVFRRMTDQPEYTRRRNRRRFLQQIPPLGSRAQRRRFRDMNPVDSTIIE